MPAKEAYKVLVRNRRIYSDKNIAFYKTSQELGITSAKLSRLFKRDKKSVNKVIFNKPEYEITQLTLWN